METSYSDVAQAESGSGAEKEFSANEEDIKRKLKSWVSLHDPDGEDAGFIRSSN